MIKEQYLQIKDLEIILWEFIGHKIEELSAFKVLSDLDLEFQYRDIEGSEHYG
ncbi:hypothetical protein [Streptococcus cristatus]|uniref:hypothetical protein n=1 Tax=Streptococcus cristatus TaxID=45634 RepID=UPI0016595391|nr:hypothetical protein [Streptococcus cristatus]